ncbi:MAG: peptide deformylase [Candidatus Yanofskybacteria bacterium CG10_big_fil_rev_8_21_14_0_10_46_23]|uniref:Peptide deformylase n=1 Tax=Candidatus Yanofskybacteria bacterium CG10_big_fil_rev_8_21_14_0_10_46_23 TaxID=1975098 RepID=A0A2H0R4R1_9BACT|nr:MAG: peptide deformylase [Candidatus Yanofskybacteria bacterium CG10_big_fil_rev_8_21_14_0_10_46_23]
MKIVKKPDRILRQELNKIEILPDNIVEIVLAMQKTMVKAEGIGLAANQVNLNHQIFIIDENLAKENNVPWVYINPQITNFSKEKALLEEGCLSIPGLYTEVPRSKKIMIKGIDQNGQKFKFKARGFLARVLQHEFDHLQGKLISDYVKKN